MSEKSKIEWCDDTHNFWRGCVKVSPGCKNCYAEVSTPVRVARSKGRELWGGTLRDRAKDFDAPVRWNEKPWVCNLCGTPSAANRRDNGSCLNSKCDYHTKGAIGSFHRRRVFSLSLGDWLDEAVPIEWLADMLDVIRRCPNLDFLLLTKRPENWKTRLTEAVRNLCYRNKDSIWVFQWIRGETIPPNVWIMCTVENQEWADKRIPELLKIPAVCRGISYEPALGPVDFGEWLELPKRWPTTMECGIHWIIVGGESGPKARVRPFNIWWARNTLAQCKAAGVACFVKQMGAVLYNGGSNSSFACQAVTYIPRKDKKGGDMAEWPEDLRVREWPK